MNTKLNFNYFTGASLYAFARSLLKIVNSSKIADGILNALLVKIETIFAHFSKGFEREPNDPLTKAAAAKDDLRDQYYKGMKNYIHSLLDSPDTTKSAAAEKLEAVIRKYGWSAESYSYDEETTAITKCIDEINTTYAAEATALNLNEIWLNSLVEVQSAFEEIQLQRIENGAKEMPTVSKYRMPLRREISTFVSTLNVFAENSDDADIKAYAGQVDELIARTMTSLKLSASHNSDEEETDDQTPPEN